MKKIFLIMAVATALFSCGQKQDSAASVAEGAKNELDGVITSTDEKTKAVIAHIEAYEKGDTTNYAPEIDENIEVHFPTDTAAALIGKKNYAVNTVIAHHQLFENIKHSYKRVSTITLNNGEVWTLVWAAWTADGKFTKKHIVLPIHLGLQWKGDKVVRENHFYDTHATAEEMAAKQAAAKK
jgi:hypothetical protein